MEAEQKIQFIMRMIGKIFVLAIAAGLSAVSISVVLFVRSLESVQDYAEQPWTKLVGDSVHAEPVLILGVLIFCLYAFVAAKNKRISNSGIVVGFFLALNMVFSLSMEHSGLTEVFLPGGVWGNLILLAGLTCLCTALTELLFFFCDGKKEKGICGTEKNHGVRRFFIAFAVLIVCWAPGILYCYPGSVMADTVNQIRSIAGLERITAANPIISTLVFGYLYQFGLSIHNEELGLFLSVIVQVLMNGTAMALTATEVYRYTKSKGWYIAVLLFFGVLPVWQNAVQLIMKDVFHTACFLLFCLQYLRCIREPKKSVSNVILLGLCALLITYTRRATFYLGVICIAVTAIVHWKKFFFPYVICLGAVVGLFMFCNHVLYPRLNIQPEWESENYSMQFQQVALYCRTHQDEMTEEEKETINRTLNFDTIVAEYTPMISDPVKITYHGTAADHQAFWKLYGNMWLRHPLTMLKAVAMGTFEHMNPWYDNPMLRVYISDVGDYLHVTFANENVYDIYHYWTGWLKVPVLRLLIGTGLYMWLTLILIGYAVRRRSFRALLGMLPVIILFIGLFMSHVNGEIRYGYPLTAATPLAFAWVLHCTAPGRRRGVPVLAGAGDSDLAVPAADPAEEDESDPDRILALSDSREQAQGSAAEEPAADEPAEKEEFAEEPVEAEGFIVEEAASDEKGQEDPAQPAEGQDMESSKENAGLWDLFLRNIGKRLSVPKRPLVYLDVLKLAAIYLVLFNHTGPRGFMYFAQHMEMPWHLLTFAFSSLDKIAVPLFFMASGALLIGREESYGKLFSRRVLRYGLILLAASFVNYWVYVKGNAPFDLLDFLRRFYTNDIVYPLWYMYSYLSFLMMLPFIRKLARGMKDKDYIWLLVSHLIMQAVGVIDYLAFRGSAYHTQYLFFFTSYSYVVYGLCGYYMEKILKEKQLSGDVLFVMIISSICAVGLMYVLTEWRCKLLNDWSDANAQSFLNSFVVIPAITVFYAMKLLFTRHPVSERTAIFLSILSACTFGVYLFEKTWREAGEGIYQAIYRTVGDFPASLVHILLSCLIGLAATLVWKLITGAVTQRFKRKK